jgi:hypothetical protein
MPTRNTLSLVFSALIVAGFFVAGLLDILDYLIVKAVLFSAFTALAIYLVIVVLKDADAE